MYYQELMKLLLSSFLSIREIAEEGVGEIKKLIVSAATNLSLFKPVDTSDGEIKVAGRTL